MKNFIVMILVFMLFFSSSALAEVLTFSTMESHPNVSRSIEQVLKEAYRRLGMDLRVVKYQNERAIRTANSGKVDGALFRAKEGIEQNYPNLIKVPVSIHVAHLVVFTKDKSIHIQGWESLLPYTVDYERGVKVVSLNLVAGTRSTAVSSIAQAFKKLQSGRTDFVIDVRSHGVQTLMELGMTDIRVLEPPLLTLESFHYLHEKNRDLLAPLTDVLKEMEREGAISAIHLHVEHEIRAEQ